MLTFYQDFIEKFQVSPEMLNVFLLEVSHTQFYKQMGFYTSVFTGEVSRIIKSGESILIKEHNQSKDKWKLGKLEIRVKIRVIRELK